MNLIDFNRRILKPQTRKSFLTMGDNVKHNATGQYNRDLCYVAQHSARSSLVAVELDGIEYFSAAEVAKDVGVSRQTLWRWRQEGKVPVGWRFRDRQILFTEGELERIRDYANRLEPANPENMGQPSLFDLKRGNG